MAVSRSSSLRQHRYGQKVGLRGRTFHHSLLEHSAEQHCAIALRRGGLPRILPSCRSYSARARRPNYHLQCALNVRTQTVRLRKYHGGQYESSSCSRSSSRLSAFSGCRIGPGAEHPGVPTLRLRTSWLRLQLRLRLPSPPLRVPSPPLRVPSSLLSLLENFEASPLPAALDCRSNSKPFHRV
jgi:hypothetical protein